MHHPHYIGHQVAVPHRMSGMADMVNGLLNNPMAIYEMGPAGLVIERTMVNWLLQKVGWFRGNGLGDFRYLENNGGGILTHGGSLANLTALSAARSAIAPEAWEEGDAFRFGSFVFGKCTLFHRAGYFYPRTRGKVNSPYWSGPARGDETEKPGIHISPD